MLLVAILLAPQFFSQAPEPEREGDDAGPLLSAYARDLAFWSTDATGQINYQLKAPTARYFDDSGLWQFDAPRWQVPVDQGEPWVGRADQGRSWDNQERARLEGNVVLSQAQPEGPITLNTESIDLTLPTRHAQTDQPVTLTGPAYKIAAIGAQAWLDEQRIELQSEVTGHYESTKP
mgnify:FL=1